MYIKETELVNFRNYERIDLKFHEKINIFTGNNAQGKTNLLEGIYISSLGRSFRPGKDSDMIKFGEGFCRSKVTAVRDGQETHVEIVIGENEKGIKVDGVKINRITELLEKILIVVFSPEDLKIVKGDPEKRRNFLDREISQIRPSYYSDLSLYRRALLQRNALLKMKGAGQADFDVWDSKLVEYGGRIVGKRKKFIEKLNEMAGEVHEGITDGKEHLEIIYAPDEFKLKENLKDDILKGHTQSGPHRDDLIIMANGTDLRRFGSQGQQRTAALSLKLSELKLIKKETEEEAVLLLDDVFSELDGDRQNFLINTLDNVQIFITTTEINGKLKERLPKGSAFYVENGNACKVDEIML